MNYLVVIIVSLFLSACSSCIIRSDVPLVNQQTERADIDMPVKAIATDEVTILRQAPPASVSPLVVKAQPKAVKKAQPKAVKKAQPKAVKKAQPKAVKAQPKAVKAQPKAVKAQPKAVEAQPKAVKKAQPKAVEAQPKIFSEPDSVFKNLPAGAVQNLPLLANTIIVKWPSVERPSALAGQIEQETCISLTHPKCFTSRAELKTSREWGVSFGQFTIAYDSKGRERFNAFKDVKKLDKELEGWRFSDRYNEKYGMTAFVIRMRSEFNWVKGAQDFTNQQAFALSGYNGGRGGVLQDRRLCAATKGCKPSLWYGNVENTSYKSRITPKGYGQSLYRINRSYVDNVQNKRSKKYIPFMMRVLKCQTNC